MENGRNVPSKPDLTVLIGLYRAPKHVHDDLEELRQAATRRGWWSSYRLPSWLHNFVGMEADASLIRNFELELIPGLLQTKAYARKIHTLGPHQFDTSRIDRFVDARLKRQEILTGEHPVELRTVISEAALHRMRGSEFAAEQLRHLLTMAAKPNVTFNVLPFANHLHQSMSGGFILLSFPNDTAPPVAYFDNAYAGQMEHDPGTVAQLSEAYDRLVGRSLTEEESSALVSTWLEGEERSGSLNDLA